MDTGLAEKKCVPCEGGTPPIAGAEAERLLAQLDGWQLVGGGKELAKEYRFPDFRQALGFVNRLGEVAESEGHHPDLYLTWGKVRVSLSTHSIGGLSENDFILAAKADRVR
ncbi:MAG TPA: 4a-hydroxytetrahydrobiopterin dehydratase [Thermoanaerobaculia bacterium]|nr:4a-hydroxytetrahydrobiopterin dehydratase [Thermoanaerobaculia bacterium]